MYLLCMTPLPTVSICMLVSGPLPPYVYTYFMDNPKFICYAQIKVLRNFINSRDPHNFLIHATHATTRPT